MFQLSPRVWKKSEVDFVYGKVYRCPVCNHEFKALRVKAAKPRLLSTDPDLRPVYQYLDVNKYDCVACEKCGYASLSGSFDKISDAQIKSIRNQISKNFKGISPAGDKYTYDEAILRCQLALANAMVKFTRTSEKAWICLKLAWLYRGKRLELIAAESNRFKELYEAEMQYIKKAVEGFKVARMKEHFPIVGMDEWTFDFLMAELLLETNEVQEAKRLVSNMIVSRQCPSRIKDKARDLRDYIRESVEGE